MTPWLCCVYAVGQLVRKLPEGLPVYGVTSIADEIFVLRRQDSGQVTYGLLHRLTVPKPCNCATSN